MRPHAGAESPAVSPEVQQAVDCHSQELVVSAALSVFPATLMVQPAVGGGLGEYEVAHPPPVFSPATSIFDHLAHRTRPSAASWARRVAVRMSLPAQAEP